MGIPWEAQWDNLVAIVMGRWDSVTPAQLSGALPQ